MPVAVAPIVADSIAAHGVGPGRAVERNPILAVAVHDAARDQAATARHTGRAAGGYVEPGFAVADHQALGDNQSVSAPVGNAEPVAGAMAAEDFQSPRRRPHSLLQLEEDAVGCIAVADTVGHVRALDAFPAAQTDAYAGAAGLVAIVETPAAHGVDPLQLALEQEVAAEPGCGNV